MQYIKVYFKIIWVVAAVSLTIACTRSEAAGGTTGQEQIPDSVDSSAESAGIASDSDSITFAFVGDIMLGTTFPEEAGNAYLPADGGRHLFKDARDILKGVDVAAGNLEGTLFDGKGTPKKCTNPNLCYAFKTPISYVKNLTDAGFDLLSMANNHVNDFGQEAVESTEKVLSANGIKYSGLRGRSSVASIERQGKKIGYVAFGHSRGTQSILDFEEVRRVVKGLKDTVDIVVVSFHGGGEGPKYAHVPHGSEMCFGENRGNVEKFAHAAIDAGADIVYGHGPHVPRAMELYNNHLIMYSLGNFCTPYRMGLGGISGYAPVVSVTTNTDGTFRHGQIHPFIQQKGVGPRIDTTGRVIRHIKDMTRQDFPTTSLQISPDGLLLLKK